MRDRARVVVRRPSTGHPKATGAIQRGSKDRCRPEHRGLGARASALPSHECANAHPSPSTWTPCLRRFYCGSTGWRDRHVGAVWSGSDGLADESDSRLQTQPCTYAANKLGTRTVSGDARARSRCQTSHSDSWLNGSVSPVAGIA